MEEFSFIDWIRRRTELDGLRFPIGPGDDCAAVRFGAEVVLITTDQCADGVHFILSECGGERAGYKVMARSLSDIAAMGARATAAVATVAVARGMPDGQIQAVYYGMRRAGDAFECPVVGGDVSAWDHPLLLTVTMLGEPVAGAPVRRNGAEVGDAVCVTGQLGGSLVSGKHLGFTPRLLAARRLVELCRPHAMIDISDGLGADLGHICRESGVGARLHAASIPVAPAAAEREDPLAAAIGDGEDYELLFTLPPTSADRLLAQQPLDVPVSRIGEIVDASHVQLVHADGRVEALASTGFRHRA